jgi:tRNA-splicing ligase RtcB (3'-phosphate/5'-hydroxy nucleic acid ligase)
MKPVKLNDWLWEVPPTGAMRVPARLYATEKLLEGISHDRSLGQLMNVATLPGIYKYALAMPDAHEGYGFPIGGVAATLLPDGVISPGGIGYDINCGVRLLRSTLTFQELKPHLQKLAAALNSAVPSGVGKGGRLKLSNSDLDKVLQSGARWAVENGYGGQDDLNNIESNGSLKEADPSLVSSHAKERGRDQVGTMGAGNHFVEIDRVAEIYDQEFGLFPDQVLVMIHTGSRGLGHQVATDYIRTMIKALGKYKISLPDSELACAPFSSPEGSDYFQAMSAAANFAWANRQLIAWDVAQAWQRVLGASGGQLSTLYDVAHNIAKVEEHDGRRVLVHRKGATRAFPGQPVIIPGSMGTASYVLIGPEKMNEAFGSTCHGAGRRLSRHAALKEVDGRELLASLEAQGIAVQTGSLRGLAEEAPRAYKDVDEVVDVVERAGLAGKVARLVPLAVVKG